MENKKSVYEILGGEAALRDLVNEFYHQMATRPEAAPIRQMHPEDLSISAEKLFFFLSGWLGGPPLFVEKYGHPRLRARHLPFAIGKAERDQWMMCMLLALEVRGIREPIKTELMEALLGLADHMRNREG